MKKDNKFKITKAELQQIIKEEYAAMAKENARAKEIKERLAQINEELETLPGNISEVEATGTKKVSATGWTGEGEGDVKFGEKFEKIGTHLKEDEELDGEIELGGDEVESDGPGYFEMKFAELGKELDVKMSGSEEEMEVEDSEEIEVGGDMGDEDEVEVEEIDEAELGVVAEEESLNEDLEEPIEGETPAQDSEARFNDYMEKDKHVKESVKRGTSILSEGFTPEKKTALDRELDRMKALAKINK